MLMLIQTENAVLKADVACKTNWESEKEKRLCIFEAKQVASFRFAEYLMAGNEFLLTQLFVWFHGTFPEWKG